MSNQSAKPGFLSALILSVIVAVLPLSVSAQTPVGPAFPVNPAVLNPEQAPAVARNASGRTVIVWQDGSTVRARRFDAAGAPLDGGVVLDSNAGAPDVAISADGGYIASWVQAGTPARAVFRRYAADGNPLGVITPVEPPASANDAVQVAITMNPTGEFAIATSLRGEAQGVITGPFLFLPVLLGGAGIIDVIVAALELRVANFAADGGLINAARLSRSDELTFYLGLQAALVGAAPEGGLPRLSGNVDVAIDAQGDAVAVWDTVTGLGVTPIVFGVGGFTAGVVAGSVQARKLRRGPPRLNSLGLPVTVDVGASIVLEAFDPAAIAFAPQSPRPSIALGPDGRYLVSYALPLQLEVVRQPLSFDDVREIVRPLRIKTMSPALVPQFLPTRIAAEATAAAVAVSASGAAVIAWETPVPGNILAQRIAADGIPLGPVIEVGNRARTSFDRAAAPIGLGVASDGSFALAWLRRQPGFGPVRSFVEGRFYTLP